MKSKSTSTKTLEAVKPIPDPAHSARPGCPENRSVAPSQRQKPEPGGKETRERTMDKTLADSYPASDPPSSIPDPSEDESQAA